MEDGVSHRRQDLWDGGEKIRVKIKTICSRLPLSANKTPFSEAEVHENYPLKCNKANTKFHTFNLRAEGI